MWRLGVMVCAFGLGVLPAAAQPQPPPERVPQVDAPRAQAGQCTTQQRVRCEQSQARAIDEDLQCADCFPRGTPMPADVVAPPSSREELPCAATEMPLSPTLPGCLPPPTDRVPPL